MVERERAERTKTERIGEVARGRERLQREGECEREREQASLQGGFPEVTVLNITEECGMLNRCQGKHTGRTTAAPNGCQGPFYIRTKGGKHKVIYVREHIWSTITQNA